MQSISGTPEALKKSGFTDADIERIHEQTERYRQSRERQEHKGVPEALRQEIIETATSAFPCPALRCFKNPPRLPPDTASTGALLAAVGRCRAADARVLPTLLAVHTCQHLDSLQLPLAHLRPPQPAILLEVLLGGHFYRGQEGTFSRFNAHSPPVNEVTGLRRFRCLLPPPTLRVFLR